MIDKKVSYTYNEVFVKSQDRLPTWCTKKSFINRLEAQLSKTNDQIDLSYYKGHAPRAWQTEALEKWINYGRKGVVEAVTGTGKTAVGIMAAADAIARGLCVLVVVPGVELLEQWHEKVSAALSQVSVGRFGNKYKDTLDDYHVLIATVQSGRKIYMLPENKQGLIIADEVHHYGTSSYFMALEESFNERLGLTATYERNDNGIADFLSPYFKSESRKDIEKGELIMGCNYARGLSDGILANFRLGLLAVDFDDDEESVYRILDHDVKKLRYQLTSSYGCPSEPFGEFMKHVMWLSEGDNRNYTSRNISRSFLKKFNDRRLLLANSQQKTEVLQQLFPIIQKATKTLIFTESIESSRNTASILSANGIPSSDFSSQHSSTERKKLLSDFGYGFLSVLVSPRVLDEGIDVPEAELGIILAASHSKRQMIQRMGRIIRPKKDGRIATFIIVFVRGTSEDPSLGTHEAFLDEMEDHASDVHRFSENPDASEIIRWYLDEGAHLKHESINRNLYNSATKNA